MTYYTNTDDFSSIYLWNKNEKVFISVGAVEEIETLLQKITNNEKI